MTKEPRAYIKDFKQHQICSKGLRDFFKEHNVHWSTFLDEGISCDDLAATGDARAVKIAEAVRGREEQ